MAAHRKYHRILLVILMMLLWTGYVQESFNLVKERGLDGDVTVAEDVRFDPRSWFEGIYQEGKEAFLNDHFGFRNTCIRINNQVNYSLYSKLNAREIVVGKDQVMFEASYILGYFGRNAIPADQIVQRFESLNMLADTLKKLNKTFLFVISPGKASYYKEAIPDHLITQKDSSNYDLFSARAPGYPGLNIIDFRSLFLQLKNRSPYPFFPKYGVHWAPYGVELAADSIFIRIERIDSIQLRRMKAINYYMDQAHDVDYDIAAGLNLLFGPGKDIIAYPEHEYIQPPGYTMPKLLVISDSFYYNLFDRFNFSFSENIFWYYFRDTRTLHLDPPPYPSTEEVRNRIMQSDIIILMVNESKIHDMGWGLLEKTDEIFGNKTANQ
jgi:hypothetical protein